MLLTLDHPPKRALIFAPLFSRLWPTSPSLYLSLNLPSPLAYTPSFLGLLSRTHPLPLYLLATSYVVLLRTRSGKVATSSCNYSQSCYPLTTSCAVPAVATVAYRLSYYFDKGKCGLKGHRVSVQVFKIEPHELCYGLATWYLIHLSFVIFFLPFVVNVISNAKEKKRLKLYGKQRARMTIHPIVEQRFVIENYVSFQGWSSRKIPGVGQRGLGKKLTNVIRRLWRRCVASYTRNHDLRLRTFFCTDSPSSSEW